MDAWIEHAVVIVLCSVLGSGGFWTYLRSRDKKTHATTKLMMGLAYTQLTTLGIQYIERGSITKDEFEDYRRYFFEPYQALGGNGVAERIMCDVSRLPFRSHEEHSELFQNERGVISNVRVLSNGEQRRKASAE